MNFMRKDLFIDIDNKLELIYGLYTALSEISPIPILMVGCSVILHTPHAASYRACAVTYFSMLVFQADFRISL